MKERKEVLKARLKVVSISKQSTVDRQDFDSLAGQMLVLSLGRSNYDSQNMLATDKCTLRDVSGSCFWATTGSEAGFAYTARPERVVWRMNASRAQTGHSPFDSPCPFPHRCWPRSAAPFSAQLYSLWGNCNTDKMKELRRGKGGSKLWSLNLLNSDLCENLSCCCNSGAQQTKGAP
jgi:hypothetical protein